MGYDIPLSNLVNQNKSQSSKGNLELTRLFNICIKVKHLDRIYQIYNKQLPTKGTCLRIEEQHTFSDPLCYNSDQAYAKKDGYKNNSKTSLSISEFKKSFQPTSLEDIIKNVMSIDSTDTNYNA